MRGSERSVTGETIGTLSAEELAEIEYQIAHVATAYAPDIFDDLLEHIRTLTRQLESARHIAASLDNELAEATYQPWLQDEHVPVRGALDELLGFRQS